MIRDYRKPGAVVMPKTLLRFSGQFTNMWILLILSGRLKYNSGSLSSVDEMGPGTYYLPVIDDKSISTKSKVEKIIFTSGRHYFTLVDERKKRGLNDTIALIRIEEICPFPSKIVHGKSY